MMLKISFENLKEKKTNYLLQNKLNTAKTKNNLYKTEFQFTAHKQFSMDKRLGTSVCTDISKYPLKNQCIQFV